MPGREALFLRVGIDRGTDGALAPIFADGSFEYITAPEIKRTRCSPTFASLSTHWRQSLAAFVPRRIAGLPARVDPDFDALVYGDAAVGKRRQLLRL